MNYCSNCGEKIEGNEQFCPLCGFKFQESSEIIKKEKETEELRQKINQLEKQIDVSKNTQLNLLRNEINSMRRQLEAQRTQRVEYIPIKEEEKKKDNCWIATAVYGDPSQPEIEILRDFRDGFMDTTKIGYNLTKFYYKTSPPIARSIEKSKKLRSIFKIIFIKPLVQISNLILRQKQSNYLKYRKIIRIILRKKYLTRHSH